MTICWNADNRPVLAVETMPHLKSAAIGFFIKLGSRHESDSLAGASHFIEHMIFKGTETRSAREIAESFERMGGQLNAFTSKEYTCVYARILDEDLYEALEIIIDMLMNAKISEKDMQVEKDVVLEEINMYEDTPDELIHDVFNRKLWQDHAMGTPILGSTDSVTNFDREQIYNFYHQKYVPSNMIVAIAGNVDENKVHDYIEEHLVRSRANSDVIKQPLILTTTYTPFMHSVAKDTEQVQLCVGTSGLSYHDERRFTLNVLNSILGGGMSSRLFQSIREELGLAYSVYSAHANYSDTGSFSISIGTSPNKVNKFFGALQNELEKFTSSGVTYEEINRTQKLMKSSLYMGMESVINRMTRLGKSILMYGRAVPVEEIVTEINKVDAAMVQDLAHVLFKQKPLSLAAIGNENILTSIHQSFAKNCRV
ncbi:MAG: insulinase family protein [Syntrophomonadaceae bacterium]|jgi:predicted Zn-dependent peptidase|nr:insulinase family protein [Syntrophomonadaceae bacterium]